MATKEGNIIFAHSHFDPRLLPLYFLDCLRSEYRQKKPLKYYFLPSPDLIPDSPDNNWHLCGDAFERVQRRVLPEAGAPVPRRSRRLSGPRMRENAVSAQMPGNERKKCFLPSISLCPLRRHSILVRNSCLSECRHFFIDLKPCFYY